VEKRRKRKLGPFWFCFKDTVKEKERNQMNLMTDKKEETTKRSCSLEGEKE
jgi:hypothetical protein